MNNAEWEPSDPLAEWELELLAEEERRRRGDDDGEAGDREPRRRGPNAGEGAATVPEPESDDSAE
jgi:hypothetical protein